MTARRRAQSLPARLREFAAQRPSTPTAVVIIAALLELTLPSALAADLSSAVIRGSSVYSPADLFAVYREHLGRPITRAGARSIATALAAKYEADGYSRPQVRLDDGLIDAGVLRVDVFETRIDAVTISGDPGPHLARLENLGEQLRTATPIRPDSMQTALRRMRELPGLTVAASTAREEEGLNVYRLDLDTDFDPVSGAARLSNRGTEEVGPNFLLGQVMANGLFAGQTNIGLMFGAATDYAEYHGLGVLANVGVGAADGRIAVTGFQSRSNPREAIVDRDDSYLRDRLSVRYTRPLPSISQPSATLFVGLDLEDLAIYRTDLRLRDERLRMLEIGSNMRWTGGVATQYAGSVEIVQGLDAFGSGLTALDLASDPRRADFTLVRMSLVRATRLGDLWSIRLDAFAQTSAQVLPYSERFKIGGDRLGRGFEVTEIAGDQGLGAKVELRRRLASAPALLGRASAYGFYDIGAAWKQDVPGRESAATAGIGFGSQGKRVSGTIELAQPLTHADVEGSTGLTLFVELSTTF
jgi:hemolysin activation/secretion protein